MSEPQVVPYPPDLAALAAHCARVPELREQFNRLTGCKFGQSATRKPIEVMIDDACNRSGETDSDMAQWVVFVYECIWCRLPAEMFQLAESKETQ